MKEAIGGKRSERRVRAERGRREQDRIVCVIHSTGSSEVFAAKHRKVSTIK
jgi:hypothetical protein